MSEHIHVTIAGGVQTIRIDRPAKKNALTNAMYAAMAEALDDAERRADVAVTLLCGLPGVFSTGNDVGEFRDYDAIQAAGSAGDPSIRLLQQLVLGTKPLVAAVDGLAIGIGTTMLLHFDLVYASPRARFRTPFLNLAIVPEAASSLLMPRRMGQQRAFQMLCLGDWLDAEGALMAGLVNAVVASEELEVRANAAAVALAKKPQEALALARRLMRGDPAEILARMEEENRLIDERLRSAEAKEAFDAFLQKRPPDFARLRKP
jgi:enoyl-CoA hydratase/carnithine racemase